MAHVHQINISDGGVPKLPVATAKVGVDGMMGDNQADKKHHGGPRQTLCLYSVDVIEELRNEGHPIQPGHAGENITLAGVDWPSIQSGDRFRVGDDLIVEFTDPATPCSKNAGWFLDRNFTRMSHTAHPGSSRWYAIVVNPGEVATGDAVEKLAD
ncbi:MAG TPA: MOSC domain-containing protein [Acidimicrobiia bacterium]